MKDYNNQNEVKKEVIEYLKALLDSIQSDKIIIQEFSIEHLLQKIYKDGLFWEYDDVGHRKFTLFYLLKDDKWISSL